MTHLSKLITRSRQSIALVFVLGAGTVSQAELTLPEDLLPGLKASMAAGLAQSPQMMVRNANAAAAAADVTGAKAARLPSVVASGSWTNGREDQAIFLEPRNTDKLYYDLSLNQALYRWGTITRGIESAKIRQSIDEGNNRLAYLSLAGSVRANYLRMIYKNRSVKKARLHLTILEKRLEATEAKRAENLASEADLFRDQLARDKAEVDWLIEEESFQTDIAMFARLLDTKKIERSEIPLEYPSPNYEDDLPILESIAQRFLADGDPRNTAIVNAEKQIKVNENTIHDHRVALRPTVSLIAGTTQDERDDNLIAVTRYEFSWTYAGLSVYWPIFDGFAAKSRLRSGLARLRAEEINLEMQKDAAMDSVQAALRSVRRLGLSIKVQKMELSSAQSHLSLTKEQLSEGDTSEAAVESAELSLDTAAISLMSTSFYYWSEMMRLLELTETDPVLSQIPYQIR